MKNILILIIALVTLVGCKKGFLDIAPESQANAENFYKTSSDYETGLVGAYEKLKAYPNMYLELSSYRSDELTLGAPTAGTQDRYNIDKFQDDASNQLLLGSWADLYNGINRCNQITTRIKEVSFAENLKNQYEAEAKFIRAYHYYNLVNLWGNVPLVLSVISPEEALKTGSTKANDILNTIADDLRFAVLNLPQAYPSNAIGRATKGAASTLLAKVLLMQKKYPEVITALEPVIGKYSLQTNVSDVFDVNKKNNTEVIFSVRFNKEVVGAGHGLWLNTTSASSSLIPPAIIGAYEPTKDKRRDLLLQARSGTSNNYLPKKFLDVISTVTKNAGNDWVLLRYADVLLMYAEAKNEVGYEASGKAFEYLNAVRQRATLNSTPVFTATTFPDQVTFREAVYKEYALELPYEGHRWFHLVRTGKAIATIQQTENVVVEPFRLVFPIPQSEIEKVGNPTIFPQNAGYN